MYNFILQTVIFLSLGVLLYVITSTLPRVSDKPEEAKPVKPISSWFSSLPLEKIDGFLNTVFERFLRRIKLLVMKFDNFLSEQLGKFKK